MTTPYIEIDQGGGHSRVVQSDEFDIAWSLPKKIEVLVSGFEVKISYSTNDYMPIARSISSVKFLNLSERQLREIIAAEDYFFDYFAEHLEAALDGHIYGDFKTTDLYGHREES